MEIEESKWRRKMKRKCRKERKNERKNEEIKKVTRSTYTTETDGYANTRTDRHTDR